MKNSKKSGTIFLFTVLLIILVYSLSNSFQTQIGEPETITYTQFLEKVEEKEIKEVIVNLREDTFLLIDNNKKKYITDNPKYVDFKKDLLTSGVSVKELHDSSFSFLNIFSVLSLILIGIIGFSIIKKSGMSKQMTLINKKVGVEVIPENITFKNVAGLKPVKKDMESLVDFMKNPKKYSERGAEMPKGAVFYGDPGTGKTLLAKALAGEAGVPFYSVSGSEFVELFIGQGAKRVRELFQKAKETAPCIVFIDEIDAIGKSRGNGHQSNDEREQTLNQLLTEIDGFSGTAGVLVIGATNRLDMLDSALLRPGRFDKHICVPLPATSEERLEIIKMYAKNKKFAEDIDFTNISKQTIGFSPSDIKSLLNEATIISVQLDKEFVDKECVDKAFFKKVLQGHEREDKNREKDELELVSWHEAGHAVVARLLDVDIPKVTVIPSTSGAGGVTFITPKKLGLLSKKELENDVLISYGGRVAEYLLLGDKDKVTTGASADIQSATKSIYSMISYYGMTEDFGMLNLPILDIDNEIILKKAIEISNSLYKQSLDLLTLNKDKLELVAKALMEKETMTGDELDEILGIAKKVELNIEKEEEFKNETIDVSKEVAVEVENTESIVVENSSNKESND